MKGAFSEGTQYIGNVLLQFLPSFVYILNDLRQRRSHVIVGIRQWSTTHGNTLVQYYFLFQQNIINASSRETSFTNNRAAT